MKIGDKIYYGSEKNQHTDEIEKDKYGYYGRYLLNGATTEHYKTIDELVQSYINSKYWFYVSIESSGEVKEMKNIEKELLTKGQIITEDSCYGEPYYSDAPGADEIIIKIIKYRGHLYYVKQVKAEVFKKEPGKPLQTSYGEEKITIKLLD